MRVVTFANYRGGFRPLLTCSILLLALGTFSGANASCAAPWLFVGKDRAHPVLTIGSTISVRGSHFLDGGCDDQGSGGVGCSAPAEEEPSTPMTDVVLAIRQHGREWKLGTASAGTASGSPAGDIGWEVTLPRQLWAGNAVLVTDADRLEVVVKR